jgi:hypothetical protein
MSIVYLIDGSAPASENYTAPSEIYISWSYRVNPGQNFGEAWIEPTGYRLSDALHRERVFHLSIPPSGRARGAIVRHLATFPLLQCL